MTNDYTPFWYTTFLETIPAHITRVEIDFIAHHMPPAQFERLLDLCCGPGRHTALLAEHGYQVLGLDVNRKAIAQAQQQYPGQRFVVADMRHLPNPGQTFDAVVNLWHSFGYFDDQTNEAVLRQVHHVLRPGGRALFDIYNREHLATLPAREVTERDGKRIHTTRQWRGHRQHVTLAHEGTVMDTFEWRLYDPSEFENICAAAGLHTLVRCAWFDEKLPPGPQHARMQFVLERRS